MVKKNKKLIGILIVFIAIAIIGSWYGLNYAAFADYSLSDESSDYDYDSYNNILKVNLEGNVLAQERLILSTETLGSSELLSKASNIFMDLLVEEIPTVELEYIGDCQIESTSPYFWYACAKEGDTDTEQALAQYCDISWKLTQSRINGGVDDIKSATNAQSYRCRKDKFYSLIHESDCRAVLVVSGDNPQILEVIYGESSVSNAVLNCKLNIEPISGANRFAGGTYVEWKLNGKFDLPDTPEDESEEEDEDEEEIPPEEEDVEDESECTEGEWQYETCPDGTQIHEAQCVDGEWIYINSICPETEEEDLVDETTEIDEETTVEDPTSEIEEKEGFFAWIDSFIQKLKNTIDKILNR